MEVICLETDAFYHLIEEVVDRIKEKYSIVKERWIVTDEAMNLLGIKSKTTLQKLRDSGEIRYSQPTKKIILYDRESLYSYLENHAKDTF
ncbi:MAG: helix-turn-helix domain-containing protein [Bacteroidia bacterium]